MIGSGAVSNQVADVTEAEVIIIVIGSNPTVNHPVAATFMKNAAKEGKTLIVMDPKQVEFQDMQIISFSLNPIQM
jgi:formate dehydrogenase major subunit